MTDLPDAVLDRVKEGFQKRLRLAEISRQNAKSQLGQTNIFEAVNSIPIAFSQRPISANDHLFLQISTTINNARFRNQQVIVSTVTDASEVAIVSALALGFLRNEHELDLSQVSQLPDEEYSRIIESYCRFRGEQDIIPHEIVRSVNQLSQKFISEILRIFNAVPSTSKAWPRPTTYDTLETFVRFKRRALSYTGADIASVFQFLSDPALSPTVSEIEAMRLLALDWRAEEGFDSFLFARLAQPRQNEREYVRNNLSRLVRGRRGTQELSRDLVRIMEEWPGTSFSLKRKPLTRLHRQVFLEAKLAAALERGDKNQIYITIVEIFCFDRGLIKFLDWSRITAAVRRSFDVSVESAFVTMLLNESEVKAHHPWAALSMGKGAFIGDLTALLRAGGSQREDLGKILSQVRLLPGIAAQVMTEAILHRDIIERLAAALTRRSANRKIYFPVGDSTYVSYLRMSAIKDAAGRNLIPLETAEAEINAEVKQLRYNYFQNRMRVGRVRVPWDVIIHATKRVLDETAPTGLLKALSTRDAAEEILPRLVHFITEKLTAYILYDGPVSIDHALSDNLRHGIVLPRFLKTFDDALQTTSRRHALAGWEVDELRGIFGSNSEAILLYRDFVSDNIKSFVDRELIVEQNGQLHTLVFDGISKILEQYFKSDSSARSRRPETKIARLVQRYVRRALKTASRRLSNQIRSAIFHELKSLRSHCKRSGSPQTKEFLDSLETNLYEALEEVRLWIGVADNNRDIIPFTLQEVVDLELLTTQFSALKRLKVRVDQEFLRADGSTIERDSIQGRYLIMFESIVHNLMSNAFNHSGAGLQTDIRLLLRLSPHRLFIRAENKVTPKKISEIVKNYSRTVTLARKTIGPEVRQDKQSGFQKIRSAVSREFKDEPVINIPPPSERTRNFVVEITLELKEAIWVES